MIGGQLYRVGVTLIPESSLPPPPVPLPPVPVPPPVPLPPPPVIPTPEITEYRDATRSFPINQLIGGQPFWLNGRNFGPVMGKLSIDTGPLLILHWDDQWIEAVAPPFVAGRQPGMWTLTRADGNSSAGYRVFLGLSIGAPPPAGTRRE